MIKVIPASGRVEKLREIYLDCPMIKQTLSYSKQFRQKLLYMEGWKKYYNTYTTKLRRSYADAYVIENMLPVIGENELIVGQPDYSPLTEAETARLKELGGMMGMAPATFGRTGHMSLDYEKLLRVGVNGLIDEVKALKAALDLNVPENLPKDEFYEGCIAELRALIVLEKRYADRARAAGLLEIAAVLDRVPAMPASTFREALQSMHFYNFNLWDLYQAGRPDQYLLPYYERDLKAGILTREEAQELIDCFCLLYATYMCSRSSIGFMVGGRDRSGKAVENELTWMFLNSIGHTRMADPSIGLCISDETSEDILDFAVELLSKGYTNPALYNDKAITAALMKYGLPPDDAHDFIHSSCVEITPCARSAMWTVSPYHNLARILLDVIMSPEASGFKNLDEVIDAFAVKVRQEVFRRNNIENRWQMERSRNGGEPLRVSCLVHDCLKRGKSINEGGAVYNQIMPNFLGMSNAVDSLAAIQSLVFGTGEMTLAELNEILDKNYAGYEELRKRIVNKIPHFGNDELFTDSLAERIAKIIAESCKGINTYRGSTLIPSAFSYSEHVRHGKETPATPDGRFAGYPLADGSGPVQGRDIKGPTASLKSSTAWDHSPFIGGIAINIKFSREQMSGALKGNMIALVKTFMDRGGFELQINSVDNETLKKAMEEPENYRDLLVRVGGYSDYFTTLPRELQLEIIDRSSQELV